MTLEAIEVEQDERDRIVVVGRVHDSEWLTRSSSSARFGRPVRRS